jgi:S-DNA-T family DNA segregation ATPase FtsK/SpoIIIE
MLRHIKDYNDKFIKRHLNPEEGHRFLPYIVVIIDEYGDLIMTAGKDIELPIVRIAQKARAVGIHMIIATQRPTTNVITGTIKANFPARIAFRVTTAIDSRTILDRTGANQLIGRGDMLFLQGADPVRVQCAFIDTLEIERITQFISEQQGYNTPYYLPEYVDDTEPKDVGELDVDKLDPLFEKAAHLLVSIQQGSTSKIQREFSIGYNRAGLIMDQLEKAGIVGPSEGSKAREVLFKDSLMLDEFLKNYDDTETKDVGELDVDKLDPLFEKAAHFLVTIQQGSTSMIQGEFSIGYYRAGRIMNQLEKAGIVGPSEGSKAREVLFKDSLMLDEFLKNYL